MDAVPQFAPLRKLMGRAALESLSDRDLLARYAAGRDADAFAAIVERHGPRVLNVCRRLLGDPHDADDVFQAVFLVLSRNANSLERPDALAAWLYGTVRRIALRARRRIVHRPLLDGPGKARDPLAEVSARELLTILDDEMAALPERLRLPVLLCAVEGRSVPEAARTLGVTPGTVKGRLERGRAKLHQRLAARGLALPAALTALLAVPRESVSATLVESTVLAVTSEAVSPAVAALAVDALPVGTKIRIAVAVVVCLCVGGLGAGLMPRKAPPPRAEAPPAKPAAPASSDESLPPGAIARFGTLRMRGCRGPVTFSPDGKYVVAAGRAAADSALVFDLQTGREVKAFPAKGTIMCLAFSPDGKKLACVSNGFHFNAVWDFETGKQVGTFRGRDVAFEPNGTYVLSSDPQAGKTQVNAFAATEENGKLPSAVTLAVGDESCFALSPNGKWAASLFEHPAANVAVMDAVTGAVMKRLNIPHAPFHGLAFDRDGKHLVAHGQNGLTVWDWNAEKELLQWVGRVFNPPGFSADGKRLVVSGVAKDESAGFIRVIDVADGTSHKLAPISYGMWNSCTFSPDGKSVAVVTEGGAVLVLDAETGRDRIPLPACTGRVWEVSLTPDRRHVVARDTFCVLVWDAATGQLLRRFPDDLPNGEKAVANTVAAGRVVTFRQSDALVRVRDLATLQEIRRLDSSLKPYDEKYGDLYRNGVVTPDGRLAALEGISNRVDVFDLDTGKPLSQYPLAGHALRYSLSEKGEFLAIEREGFAGPLVLDPRTGKELDAAKWSSWWETPGGGWPEFGDRAVTRLRALNLIEDNGGPAFAGETGYVTPVMESAGSRYLAVSGRTGLANVINEENKPTFSLFDLTRRRRLAYISLPSEQRFALFSPDCRLFATTTMRGSVHIWEVATGRERMHFEGHLPGEVTALWFSRDGRTLLSGGADTQVIQWNLFGSPPKAEILSPERMRELWNLLANDDPASAHAAARVLFADPRTAVAWIVDRLKPAAPVDGDQLAKWTAQLGDADFATRERATAELAKAGELAVSALRKQLEQSSPEQKRRAEKLLREAESGALSGERLRAERAVELLERLDSPESRRQLAELAKGVKAARLTREAKAALRRLVRT